MPSSASDHARSGPLDTVVDVLPKDFGDQHIRNRLRTLARNMDELTFEDGNGDVFIDRNVLRRIVRDMDNLPDKLKERVRQQTEQHLGPRVKERGQGRPVNWRGLAQRSEAMRPAGVEELSALGLRSDMSTAEANAVIRQQFPDFPGQWLNADAQTLRQDLERAVAHNRTWWDCVVSKLGLWAAIQIVGILGGALIITTATAGWGTPLAIWLIGVFGFSTAVVLLNCAINPNWY